MAGSLINHYSLLPSQPQLILKNMMMESPQAVSDLYLAKCIANYICIIFYTESALTSQDGKVYSQFTHTCIVCITHTITMEVQEKLECMYVLPFVLLFRETSGVADSNNDSDPERGGRVHSSTIVYQHTSWFSLMTA